MVSSAAVDNAMSSGVAWDDLGPLKAEARQMKYNKSSWGRSLRAAAAAHDVIRDKAARDGAAGEAVQCATAEGVDWRTAVALVPPTGLFTLEQKSLRTVEATMHRATWGKPPPKLVVT